MDIKSLAFSANDWVLAVFNKEGIALFVIFCVMTFMMASIAAVWAVKNGQFTDLESSKFEMMEE